MIAITRFQVAEGQVAEFTTRAAAAVAVLAGRDGFLTADVGRNLDEPDLFTITTRWRDVGSYRRALSGYEARAVVVPLLSSAIDEPSAYEEVDQVGANWARGSTPLPLPPDR